MKELLMQFSFKQFLKTPFSWIFLSSIVGLIYLGHELLSSKDDEIIVYRKKVEDCYQDQKEQQKLLQNIILEKEYNSTLKQYKNINEDGE